MDYKYLRFQVIDTPGILDHPLEERNLIEMQSITALAHLRCAVLFILDISEHCGYSIAQQVSVFLYLIYSHSITTNHIQSHNYSSIDMF
jgi:nucleolar GTP-binding protein